MKATGLLLLCFVSLQGFGQAQLQVALKKQLDSVMVLDQKYRELIMIGSDTTKKDSIATLLGVPKAQIDGQLWKLQTAIDSSNLHFIEAVIKRYGYPGKSLVDTPSNEVAWYVIQHSTKIPQYMDLIKKAGEKGELPFRLVAMMEDRYLMDQGKEQLYGTQGTCRVIKTGKQACFIWPIKDPEHVNERRKKAGFDLTVEQNAKRLGMEYHVVKLSDVQ